MSYVSTALPPPTGGALGACSSTLLCGEGVGVGAALCGAGVDSCVFVVAGAVGGATSSVLLCGPCGVGVGGVVLSDAVGVLGVGTVGTVMDGVVSWNVRGSNLLGLLGEGDPPVDDGFKLTP